jgi:cellobiose epimerase
MDRARIKEFAQRARKELYEDIVPFWSTRCIDERGGFIGRMTNEGVVDKRAPKGLVLNARILWTFSALYVFDKKKEHLVLAKRAYDYLMEHFWDKQYGGMFWVVNCVGRLQEDNKQTYGQAFAIYALSEYYRAAGNKEALDKARAIFDLLERYAWDKKYKGYYESFDRDWKMSKAQQLTLGDMAAAKSMNTSLHALEAIANLYDVCKDPLVGQRVEDMLEIYADYIAHPYRTYCQLFFSEAWCPKNEKGTFGHDIEASWLVYWAARILNKPKLLQKIRWMSVELAESVYEIGLDNKTSVFYEADNTGISDSQKQWWVQAEAVVGFLNAYQLTHREDYLEVAYNIWGFIEDSIIDKTNGEWFFVAGAKSSDEKANLKVSEWKCPYHNGRACMEIITRLEKI